MVEVGGASNFFTFFEKRISIQTKY